MLCRCSSYLQTTTNTSTLNEGESREVWILLFSVVILFDYNVSTIILSPIVAKCDLAERVALFPRKTFLHWNKRGVIGSTHVKFEVRWINEKDFIFVRCHEHLTLPCLLSAVNRCFYKTFSLLLQHIKPTLNWNWATFIRYITLKKFLHKW